jgi:hypothetical protein
MTMKYCSYFFFLLAQVSFAQHTLKGSIKSPSGVGLAYVSVGLLKSDSTIVKGTSTDAEGGYVFENVKTGQYRLVASGVGYEKAYSPIFQASDKVPALVLQESSTQLNEVQVKAKQAFIEQQIDRTVMNVANSIVGSGITALEVLAKAPNVTVDFQNEAIQLRSKEGTIVLIDGKQTYLSGSDLVAMLRGMSSSNIDKIEIITNPSAKYDAAGNSGIINIKLKKNAALGSNGALSLAGGSGQHYRSRGDMQFNHRTQKLNFFGNYGLNKGQNFFELLLYRNQPDGTLRNYIDQRTHLVFDDFGHNAKAGFDVMPTQNTTLGVVWMGQWNTQLQDGMADFDARRNPNSPVYLQTNTHKILDQRTRNQLFNVNFQQNFANKGVLTVDLDYGVFGKDVTNNLDTQSPIVDPKSTAPVPYLTNVSATNVTIKTMKADYSRTLSNKWKLEAGLKRSDVQTSNDILLKTGDNRSNLVLDPQLSSHFEYTEQVTAAYASVSGTIQKTTVQAGLRAEHTHSVAELTVPQTQLSRNYLNWFPSIFVSRALSEKQTLIASYSHRINRPNYQYLNPSRGFIDLYAYSEGNIEQTPQYTHAVEVRYALKMGFFASLTANFIKDFTMPVNSVTEGNKLVRVFKNIGNARSYALTLSQPITVAKQWQMQATLMGYYDEFDYTYESTTWHVQNTAARLSVNNGFTFGKGWTAELNGWVNSPSIQVVERSTWLSSVDVGVQKTLSSKAKLKLSVQNIFFTPLGNNRIETANSLQLARFQMDTRVVMLNFTHNFGNDKLKAARQRRTGAEEESRRAN